MLNARIYRTAWLVAGVALIVALLTLQSRPAAPEPNLPVAFDGQAALEAAGELEAAAPERAPGTAGGDRAADWVRDQLSALPGLEDRVQEQEFVARADGRMVQMRNVYVVVPGDGNGATRPAILVVAPRDTPVGVRSGASATGLLVSLARQWATTRQQRPILFVSTDGSTVGNAGVRWFLSRFSQVPIEAAVVLDDPGARIGDGVALWSWGRTPAGSLGLAAVARASVERAGGAADPSPGLFAQVARLAVPQTFGDQGPVIDAGIPAVTISGRPDSPPVPGPTPDVDRMEFVGSATADLVASLDAATSAPAVAAQVEIGGRLLGEGVLRVVVLLLSLPVLVAGVDAFARLRRAGVPIRPGVDAVLRHTIPLVALVVAGYTLALLGMLPGAAAGAPPLPADVPFGAVSGLAVAIALAAAALAVLAGRRRARRRGAGNPAAEAAAAAAVMALIATAALVIAPFELLVALPLMHGALVATVATRRWQVAALGALALVPFLLVPVVMAGALDRNPVYAAWYLTATTLGGMRGLAGIGLAILAAATAWSLAALVVLRAQKGLVAAGHRDHAHAHSERDARRRRRQARHPGPRGPG